MIHPENSHPMCEECDIEMHPFAFDGVEGYACGGCGWSFDTTEPEEAPMVSADNGELPYIETTRIVVDRKYNKLYGDDRRCVCGHQYHRHFDSYENNEAVGCKYCDCYTFVEKKE